MTYKLYDLLGIQKGASAEDIKRAYKKAAVQHHPDKGGDPEVFKEVSAAYQLLSNGEERQRYDALGDDDYKAATEGVVAAVALTQAPFSSSSLVAVEASVADSEVAVALLLVDHEGVRTTTTSCTSV